MKVKSYFNLNKSIIMNKRSKNVLIVGSGRMGIRHAQGAIRLSSVNSVTLTDISRESLEVAKKELETDIHFNKLSFALFKQINYVDFYDVAIIATTATDRLEICKELVQMKIKNILVEKPLGQNLEEIIQLSNYIKDQDCKAYVNLNMRLDPDFYKVKNDLMNLSQFEGELTVTVNSGAIGIGANGIHYLDYLIYLFEADDIKIINSFIDFDKVSSARGPNFFDFGGWILFECYKMGNKVATCFLSLSSKSSVFGGFDIVGPNGRITINQSFSKRVDILRKEDSEMPVYRYHADYLPARELNLESVSLSDLTAKWLESLFITKSNLPTIEESVLAHKLMFAWLDNQHLKNAKHPIT